MLQKCHNIRIKNKHILCVSAYNYIENACEPANIEQSFVFGGITTDWLQFLRNLWLYRRMLFAFRQIKHCIAQQVGWPVTHSWLTFLFTDHKSYLQKTQKKRQIGCPTIPLTLFPFGMCLIISTWSATIFSIFLKFLHDLIFCLGHDFQQLWAHLVTKQTDESNRKQMWTWKLNISKANHPLQGLNTPGCQTSSSYSTKVKRCFKRQLYCYRLYHTIEECWQYLL